MMKHSSLYDKTIYFIMKHKISTLKVNVYVFYKFF